MPPRIIHLVRHAEGQHNVDWQHDILDPILTAKGHSQCSTLSETFPYQSSVTHIFTSPLKRTIQTTLESFGPSIDRLSEANPEWRIISNPLFQETGEWLCDIGSTVPDLREYFSGVKRFPLIDFSAVEKNEVWPMKPADSIFAPGNVEERARLVREYFFYLTETTGGEVVLVTHGGFLHYLTEDWEDYNEVHGTGWNNTDFRSYYFAGCLGGEISLVETNESKERRKKTRQTDEGVVDEVERREVEAGHHSF
ncbi:hypothetical protein ABW19_dt0205428 [Dactylella cylindrospora]|nr:hypothetical protein ABW19_dt0205428 [Dactylella cylindrospora]